MKNTIKDIRAAMGISQENLAVKCGVTRQTINAIENDKYNPTLHLAFKLSQILGAPIEELFLFEEEA